MSTRTRQVVFTAGSVLRGDDAAGPMLAKMIEENPIEGWDVVDGGQTPEDDLGYLRRLDPARIIVVDAAKMDLLPGEIRRLEADDVAESFLITTHSLPMSFLLNRLYEMCDTVEFLGIQVKTTEFFDPLSQEVRDAVEFIYQRIAGTADFSDIQKVGDAE